MSASREKKQRQGGTPSNKALTAQQQAGAARRKTIQYVVIGVVIAVLVAALLIWNSGFFQSRTTAATVGGTSYTAADLSYYYHSSRAYQETMMYAQMYAQYGMAGGYDTSLSPKDQTYSTDSATGEVTTYHDYFLRSAMEDLESITALYDAAVADGHTTADVRETVDDAVASAKSNAVSRGYTSYSQFLAANYGRYVTPAVYERAVTRTALANLYVSDYADALEYSDSDLQSYYSEHADELDTFEYSYLYFTPETVPTTDEDGNAIEMSDEERAAEEEKNLLAAKAKADEALAALKDGKSAADVIEEFSPNSSNAEAVSTGSSLSSIYSEWLTAASRKAGDVDVIENGTSGFYVVLFQSRYLDDTVSANVRHILVRAETDEGATAPTEEQLAAAKAKAEDILARWKSGEATEASFAALADELSEDGRGDDGALNAAGGLYEKVIPGQFVTPFNDWLFNGDAHTAGDTGIIEVSSGAGYYGCHVAYFVGSNEGDYAWQYGVRDTLSNQDTQEWMDGLAEGYSAQTAGGLKYVGA